MHKYINIEDTLFILCANIRMIRDMLRLDPDPGLFLEKTASDIEFIDRALESLTGSLIENTRFLDREPALDMVSDIEWQFGQLLAGFTGERSPFPADRFPEISGRLLPLRDKSAARRKTVDESTVSAEGVPPEPVVSSLELSELLQKY